MPTDSSSIDLPRYLARIELPDTSGTDPKTLRAIHLAHATHIPFENVDVLLGKPIRLDLPSLYKKLIDERRGGYCFEQNTLLAAALEAMGFEVHRLLARVHPENGREHPRTHMVLEVVADGRSWMADVGFGAWGLLEPIALCEGESRQHAWAYRLRPDGDEWRLAAQQAGRWRDLHTFSRQPQLPVDFEPANFYTSAPPESIFRRMLIVQRTLPERRYMLRDRELIVTTADSSDRRVLNDDDELLQTLADCFNLRLEAGPWLPAAAS